MVFDPHVRAGIICIVLSFVALGVGWLLDEINKDRRRRSRGRSE
jgi:hypothetical protein